MTLSFFRSFYRSLSRHRLFALLNIGGLALGIAVFLVLFLFVRFETGYDRVLPGSDRLWVMREHYTMPGYPTAPNYWTMGGELDQLRADFPQLEGTRFSDIYAIVRNGAEATNEDFAAVDPNFFDFFPYPALEGDPRATLASPDGLVISQKMARKYFGSESAIGRTLTLVFDGNSYAYRVGAVLADAPENVSMSSEMYGQLTRERFGGQFFDHWGSSSLRTILRFPDAAAAQAFEQQLPAFLERRAGPTGNFTRPVSKMYRQSLLPLTDFHLSDPSDRNVVTTLGIVGVLTLLIAIVNYVNLATARSALRAREVAMRKVLGATRRMLVFQFLAEAVATVAFAALIGLALAEIALPFVNTAGGTSLDITYFGSGGIVLPLAALVLVVGVIAGLYPAFALSHFRPAAVLASARAPGGGRAGRRLRSALVVVQFAIAIAFAIGTGVMLAQADHLRKADIGFKRDGLVVVRSYVDSSLDDAQKADLLAAFRALPGVTAVAVSDQAPGEQSSTNFSSFNRPGQERGASVMTVGVGPGFFDTYGARLVTGRLFDGKHAGDARREKGNANLIINETAVRELGFKDPRDAIGKQLMGGNGFTIVGVVADMRFRTPRQAMPPMAWFYMEKSFPYSYAVLRYQGVAPNALMAALEQTWKRVAPGVPFSARTVENNLYERFYKEDDQRGRLFTIGAMLAVLIGCIGLYGLAAFDTARRVKEIGIRKTLGASTRDVLTLLIGQFLRPVVIANLIAWPLAWVAMQRWLSGFDDRVALSWTFFAIASLGAVAIAVVTVFGQAWRVARSEPARALRYE